MGCYFSIVIPMYNCEKTIASTLDSVLMQSYNNYEVIVVNDCSKDNSLSIINSYIPKFGNKLIVLNNDVNMGVANSRNSAFSIAKGFYIALLDGDDVWNKNKLELQKKCIEETNCDICCTSYDFINVNGDKVKKPYIIPKDLDYNDLLYENFIGCSSVVVRKKLLNNKSMNNKYSHEDYALWLLLIRNGAKIITVTDVLMHYRLSETSRSYNKYKAAINRFKVYKDQENIAIFKCLYYLYFYIINGIRKKML